jgi:hypothetical protein
MGGVSTGAMEIADGMGSSWGRFRWSGEAGSPPSARRRGGSTCPASTGSSSGPAATERDTACGCGPPGFDGVNYQADFRPEAGAWVDLRLPYREFLPVFRGRPVPDCPPLDPAGVRSFGLIVAGRQAGPFRLEIKSIHGYRDPSPSS